MCFVVEMVHGYILYSSCDLIGQLPLDLHGDVHQIKDHARLDSTINGLLLLQKSGLLLPALTKAVCFNAIAIQTLSLNFDYFPVSL
jgi:hypothetical protein